jgi:transposase InsO family protein
VLTNPSIDLKKEKGTVALISNKHKQILFDKIPVGKGMLLGVDIPPLIENLHTAVVDYQALHEILGHANDKKVAATAKKLGIKYTGHPHPCEHCAQAKLRIKNIRKVTTHVVATDIGERIMFDISSVRVPSMGENQFWLLVMDEYSGYLWSFFFRHRSYLTVTMTAFVKMFPRAFDTNILRVRCDNAWKNKTFQATFKEDMPSEIQFEYTAPHTPQQNGRIEQKFATLYGKMFALTTAYQLNQKLRNDLWPHAAHLVTSLENTIVDQKGSTPHFILKGKDPNWAQNLRTFEEIGIVYTKPPIRNKFTNHGSPCMFIGYAEDHTSNVFKLYNPKTSAFLLSRNVYWLNKSYGEFCKVRPTANDNQLRQTHRNMAEVTFDLPDRKYRHEP